MMSIISRTRGLYAESGLFLFVLRVPARAIRVFANLVTTRFYAFFLGEMGANTLIEYGVKIEGARNVSIGRNVYIGRGTLIVSEIKTAKLRIGDNVQINRSCHIDHTGGLTIGDNSLISEEAVIYCHSHGMDPRSPPQPIAKTIGKNCWIGARAMLLAAADVIADDTLVAAGSIVSRSINEIGGVFAGVPARRISAR